MKANMAGWDRVARAVIGVALIVLVLTGIIGVWGWIGVVPLVTAAIGNCPAYSIFGFSTCKFCGSKQESQD